MLDFLIGSALVDKDKLQAIVAEDFKWEVVDAYHISNHQLSEMAHQIQYPL
jgi:hypothetical protein